MVKPTRAEMRTRALQELELPPDATPEEIKTKYRSLILLHHPDKHQSSEESVQKTQRLNEANEILTKPETIERDWDEQDEEELLRRFGGLFNSPFGNIFFFGGGMYMHHGYGYEGGGGGRRGGGGSGRGRGGAGGGGAGRGFGGYERSQNTRGGYGGAGFEQTYSDEDDEDDGSSETYTDSDEEEAYFENIREYIPHSVRTAMGQMRGDIYGESYPKYPEQDFSERIKERELADARRKEESQKNKEKKEREREQNMAEGAARRAQKNSQKKALHKQAAEEASNKAQNQRLLAQKLRSNTFKAARDGDEEGVKKGVWEDNVAPDGGEWLEGFEPQVEEKQAEEKVESQDQGQNQDRVNHEYGKRFRKRRGKAKEDSENVVKEDIGVKSTPPIGTNATTTSATAAATDTLKEPTGANNDKTRSKRGKQKPKSPSQPSANIDHSPSAVIGNTSSEPAQAAPCTPPEGPGEESAPMKKRRRKRPPKGRKEPSEVVEENKVDSSDPVVVTGTESKQPPKSTGRSKKAATRVNGGGQAQPGAASPATSSAPSPVIVQEHVDVTHELPSKTAVDPNLDSNFNSKTKRHSASKSKPNLSSTSTSTSPSPSTTKKSTDPKETLLHIAVSKSSFSLVTWLMNHGALAEERDSHNYTPFHRSISLGLIEIVEFFIKTSSIDRLESWEEGEEEVGNAAYPLPKDETLLSLAIRARKEGLVRVLGKMASVEEAEDAWELMREEEFSEDVKWEKRRGGKKGEEGKQEERKKMWEGMRWALVESGVEGWEVPEAWRGRRKKLG